MGAAILAQQKTLCKRRGKKPAVKEARPGATRRKIRLHLLLPFFRQNNIVYYYPHATSNNFIQSLNPRRSKAVPLHGSRHLVTSKQTSASLKNGGVK